MVVDDVPRHFEAVCLKSGVTLAGWLTASFLVAVAVTLGARVGAGVGRTAGGLLGTLAVLLVFALVRCRRFETSVGASWLETRLGPFHRKPPLGLVAGAAVRPATSWRRFFADEEVVVELAAEQLLVPSREPVELLAALKPGG